MKTEIVWLEDPLNFTYLRETKWCSLKPKQIRLKTPIWGEQAEIIGYEIFHREQGESAQSTYTRRVWWLKKHDLDIDPNGIYKNNQPSEAVIPSSISVGKKSAPYKTSK